MIENKKTKGLIFGIIVGLAWGLDSVFMGQVSKSEIFEGVKSSGLITAFLHDGFAFMWISLFMLFRKDLKSAFMLMKTRTGKVTMLAAVVGAPIGMSGYVLGIQYAGAAYAASISVIYPAIGAIFAYLILKEKISKKAIIGILISLLGSAMIGFTGAVGGEVSSDFFIGIGFTLLAVVAWALEGTIIAYAMKGQKDSDGPKASAEQLLTLRYFVSIVVYGLVIMPLIGGYGVVGEIFVSGLFVKFALIATLGVTTYLCWYKAVSLVGGALGTALNSTSAFWAVVFGALLFGAAVSATQIFWCIVIIVGVFIFATGSKKKGE